MNFDGKHFNRKLYRLLQQYNMIMLHGDRGVGKSTVLACIARIGHYMGYKVFSQYPYKDCYQIPMVSKTSKGVNTYQIDKEWLYTVDLSNSIVMIDEAKSIWNARAYTSWTMQDEELINFARKNNTIFVFATQNYDQVDLNLRRACDLSIMLDTCFFPGWCYCECTHTKVCKVADRNTEVLGRQFKRGMRKVVYDVCETNVKSFRLKLNYYYNDFFSMFYWGDKITPILKQWNDEWERFEKEVNNAS